MNVWSEKKIHEKLNYMHNNPVKRVLVAQPGDWPWSRGGGEVLLLEEQFCLDYGPDSLRCNCERSDSDNWGADIQTNVCATATWRQFTRFRHGAQGPRKVADPEKDVCLYLFALSDHGLGARFLLIWPRRPL
jgi:hypothetical protein